MTTNTFMPQVEKVAEELAGPMVPHYAPSQRALLHIGEKFHESNSTNLTMVVFEATPTAGRSGPPVLRRLDAPAEADTKHVQYVMDLWGKPFTAAGAQSLDGKCTYVLLRLAGDIGQIQANQSVDAVRDIINKDTPPAGLKVYVSGAAPLASDTLSIANASLNNVTIVTILLIIAMLLMVYRSVATLLVPLAGVLIEMLVAKGVVSTLGHFGYIELSSFAVNIVIALTLGAGTDYGIFLMGRYHEARQAGESREESFYIAYKGVTPIIIGSGLTIAGACYCLTFARLNYFHTMGPAVAISMLFTIAAALTLGPALLTVGSLFGMFDPERAAKAHLYRRIGASVVRWPVPILAASSAIVMIGAIFVPTYRQNYDDRQYQPADAPANLGFQAADRHFPKSKLFSEMLMIETDHDMRNSADFISLDRVARTLIRLHRRRDGAKHHQALGPGAGACQDSLSVHHPGQRERSTAPVQQAAKRQYQQAGGDPGALRRGLAERDRLFPKDVRRVAQDRSHHRGSAKGHRRDEFGVLQSRRFLPADQKLFLLGKALFRCSHLLDIQIGIRHARPHRQLGRRYQRRQNLPRGHRQDLAANHHPAETHGRRHGGT